MRSTFTNAPTFNTLRRDAPESKEVQRMTFRYEALKQRIEVILNHYPELKEDEDLRMDTLEGATDLKDVIQRAALNVLIYSEETESVGKTISRLTGRKERFKKRTEFYRQVIQELMELADLKKMALPEATITIQNAPAKVVITDEEKLPDSVMKVSVSVDKVKLKEMLKEGPVDGAELSNGGTMLVIR